jgi:DNA-binding transcriptional regulator GbsR (MarR family)
MKNVIIKQLGLGSFWSVSKELTRNIGFQRAGLLQHFIDLQFNIFSGKEFYQQQERIMEEFGWGKFEVSQHIKDLSKLELITVTKKGLPAKNYYFVNTDKIMELLSDNTSTTDDSQNIQSKGCKPLDMITTTTKVKKVREIKEKEVNLSSVINDYLNEPEPILNNDDSLNEEIDVDELDFGKYNNI